MKPNIVSTKFREVLCSNFNTVVFNIYFFILDFQTKFKVGGPSMSPKGSYNGSVKGLNGPSYVKCLNHF